MDYLVNNTKHLNWNKLRNESLNSEEDQSPAEVDADEDCDVGESVFNI